VVEVDGPHARIHAASKWTFELPALEGSAALTAVVLAYWMGARAASVSPWYLNTVGYVLMGASMTGMYDIAFGCTSLAPKRRFGSGELSRVIGQAALLLLLRPLQSLHVVTLPEKGMGLFRVWVSKVRRSFSFSALCDSAKQAESELAEGLRAPSLRIVAQFAAVSIFAAVFFPTMVLSLVCWPTPPTPRGGICCFASCAPGWSLCGLRVRCGVVLRP
jgi:hypothetical protein